MILTIDVETVPTTDPDFIADITAKIKHPGNMSKPETIAKWEIEDKPGLIQKAVGDTSFDGSYGSIVCIGFAWEDDEPTAFCCGDELEVLGNFANAMEAQIAPRGATFKVVGHNVADFDLRILWQRLVINGIARPKLPWNAKAWDERIGDTMKMWNPASDKKISLDKLCKILKVPTSKADMDGSMVAEYARSGRYDEIGKYCGGDIISTRACYRKMI